MPRKTDSKNPADWLFIAESDLAGVRELARQEISYYLCQSKLAEILEKLLKAELIRLGWVLLKTHDVQELAEELRLRNPSLFGEVELIAEALSDSYFISRYPGFDMPEPDWSEMRELLEKVQAVLAVVKASIEGAK